MLVSFFIEYFLLLMLLFYSYALKYFCTISKIIRPKIPNVYKNRKVMFLFNLDEYNKF